MTGPVEELRAMRSYFDNQAASYDEYTAGDNWTPNVVLAEVLFGSGPDVRTVFDLGTGTGQTLAAVAALYPAAQLTGCDLSPEMLARAARRLPHARLIEGEASVVLRTETASFDLEPRSVAWNSSRTSSRSCRYWRPGLAPVAGLPSPSNRR
jgi:ubiquinone/menaquinone biosynthesis C-methylase UbiE